MHRIFKLVAETMDENALEIYVMYVSASQHGSTLYAQDSVMISEPMAHNI